MELTRVVDAWIAGESAARGSPDYETNWWAISEVSDWSLERRGDLLWRLILAAYKRSLPDKVIAVLAAGPLEDLLAFDLSCGARLFPMCHPNPTVLNTHRSP